MTRSELVTALAQRFPQLQTNDTGLSVNVILERMAEALTHGDRIEKRGFGSFKINFRLPRTGRNPKTGQCVQVPAKAVPHFKPGKELRDRVG
ncbi:integration host factor (IHF), DNA-binding protein, beta subunit [Georgfuchsia toluolica]|uniref:Integration host factor (IHF), DNA-binding protein, beta subunit n=1 Tax=Georgfuchsia toluolica TaxID=424218 RepID=A0A916NHS9_9PROT|nr:integration host factor subunit beta [Georgfuchsia toluolica]CAG4883721.1 integration host factor (IHF), DNA-binding protein, beta subunit [Georgfuchsia toluolica]